MSSGNPAILWPVTAQTITVACSGGIYGPGSWNPPAPQFQNEFLPKKEAITFLVALLSESCSENDAREILTILFTKFSESEDLKISPEVVTALMSFFMEKYA